MKKSFLIVFAVCAMVAGGAVFQLLKWDFETLSGERYEWQDLQGQWVVVNYFAEWCAPCLKEIPELNEFADHARDTENLAMFAISYDLLSDQELSTLQQKYDIQFPLIKPQLKAMPFERPPSLPVTYVIDPQGNVRKKLMGEQTDAGLRQIITALQAL